MFRLQTADDILEGIPKLAREFDHLVLDGPAGLSEVTRAILLEEITVPGIQVVEEEIELGRIGKADDVFITSSTQDLLGVSAIDQMTVAGNAGVRASLLQAFHLVLHQYVSQRRATASQ